MGPRSFISGNIFFKFSVHCLCCWLICVTPRNFPAKAEQAEKHSRLCCNPGVRERWRRSKKAYHSYKRNSHKNGYFKRQRAANDINLVPLALVIAFVHRDSLLMWAQSLWKVQQLLILLSKTVGSGVKWESPDCFRGHGRVRCSPSAEVKVISLVSVLVGMSSKLFSVAVTAVEAS